MVKYSKLPSKLYYVRVPLMATYTDLELEVSGTPIMEHSNGRRSDIDEQLTLVMLPLTRIIDIYSMGCSVMLVNSGEVTEIYNALEDYLKDTDPGEFNAPIHHDSRDMDIDKFASEMFSINRQDIVDRTYNRKSGFDIGLNKMAIPNRVHAVRGRINITDAYSEENPSVKNALSDIYLTHETERVDPDKVIRKPKIRKRQRLTPKGDVNV